MEKLTGEEINQLIQRYQSNNILSKDGDTLVLDYPQYREWVGYLHTQNQKVDGWECELESDYEEGCQHCDEISAEKGEKSFQSYKFVEKGKHIKVKAAVTLSHIMTHPFMKDEQTK